MSETAAYLSATIEPHGWRTPPTSVDQHAFADTAGGELGSRTGRSLARCKWGAEAGKDVGSCGKHFEGLFIQRGVATQPSYTGTTVNRPFHDSAQLDPVLWAV